MSISRVVLLFTLAPVSLLGGCDGGAPPRTSDEERAAFRGKPMPPEARAKMQAVQPRSATRRATSPQGALRHSTR